MEKLIAQYRCQHADRIAYGWCWTKSESKAVNTVQEQLKKKFPDSAPILLEVWTCDWRTSPSAYKRVFGVMDEPSTDLAGVIRKSYMRSPGESKREWKQRRINERKAKQEKPHVRLAPPTTSFNFCTPREAK